MDANGSWVATDATSGIGTCRRASLGGWNVLAVDRDGDRLERPLAGEVEIHAADASRNED